MLILNNPWGGRGVMYVSIITCGKSNRLYVIGCPFKRDVGLLELYIYLGYLCMCECDFNSFGVGINYDGTFIQVY